MVEPAEARAITSRKTTGVETSEAFGRTRSPPHSAGIDWYLATQEE